MIYFFNMNKVLDIFLNIEKEIILSFFIGLVIWVYTFFRIMENVIWKK